MLCDPPLRILDLSYADLVVRLLLRSSHRGWSPGQTRRANSRLKHPTSADRYSITSSARASKLAGTESARALAAFELITSSYLVGACTGRSAALAPLNIRST